MKAAVLGSPVAHSLSPALHLAAYQALGLSGWSYQAIECDEGRLPGLLAECGPDWAGLSLTMPLKRAVLGLLDDAEPLVTEVGAANTVLCARRGWTIPFLC
jgi:shikimate dehydrogenase